MGRRSWRRSWRSELGKLSAVAIVAVGGCGRAEPSRVAPVQIVVPGAAPASSGSAASRREPVVDEEPPDKPAAAEAPDEEGFSCSMHPQIQRATSGSCPICGMDLVEK